MTAVTTGPPTTMSSRDTRLIALLLGAAFVAILNETTMGVAIKHLIDDLGILATDAQWLTTAFMLTMAVVIPTTGFMLQRLTTRQVFLLAMGLFTTGTAIACFAGGFEVLLVARVVQASGTAIMMPLLMTTTMTLVPPASRGRFMGRVSIVMSLAPAIGPTMAGFILDAWGWRWVFGVVLPIAVLALLAGAKFMVNTGTPSKAPLDVLSVILSAFAFGGLVYGVSQVGGAHVDPSASAAELAAAQATSTMTMTIALTVGAISLALFIWRQLVLQRVNDALLDLRVFLSKNFTIATVMMLLLSLGFFGALTVLPLYLQGVAGFDAKDTGLMMLPGAIAMGLLGPVIGRIYDAIGPRALMVPGTMLTSAVLWFYATSLTPTTPAWVIVVAQMILSIGLAMSFTPLFTSALGSVKRQFYSHGSAVISTIQQVAGAAGVAVLITVMTNVTTSVAESGVAEPLAGAEGTRAAFVLAAIISIPIIVLAFLVKKPADDAEFAEASHGEPAADHA